RKLDVPRCQRRRWPLGGPLTRLRHRGRGDEPDGNGDRQPNRPIADHPSADHPIAHHCAPAFPDGSSVSTIRFSGLKYVRATRCTSATLVFWKMSNSPSAVLMSRWITTACASTLAFDWFDSRCRM